MRTIFIPLLLSALSFLQSACQADQEQRSYLATEATSSDPTVAVLERGINRAMIECPTKVWPDYDWTPMKVIVSDSKQRKAWEWDGREETTRHFKPVAYDDLPSSITDAVYALETIDGQKVLGLSLSHHGGNADELLALALHEGFHFVAQDDWRTSDVAARNTIYPLQVRPRYLRYMLFKSLLSTSGAHSTLQLQAARHWYDRYGEEFPEEREELVDADRFEGTAQYAEEIAMAIARKGCEVAAEELHADAAARLEAQGERMMPATEGSLESYLIPSRAGFYLQGDAAHAGWQERVKNSPTSALDILLANVIRVAQEDDEAALKKTEAQILELERWLKPMIDSFVEAKAARDNVAVYANSDHMSGAFGAQGFFELAGSGEKLTVGMEAVFRDAEQSGSLTLKGLTVEDPNDSPCGEHSSAIRFYLPRALFTENRGTLTTSRDELVADNVRYDGDGESHICLMP